MTGNEIATTSESAKEENTREYVSIKRPKEKISQI